MTTHSPEGHEHFQREKGPLTRTTQRPTSTKWGRTGSRQQAGGIYHQNQKTTKTGDREKQGSLVSTWGEMVTGLLGKQKLYVWGEPQDGPNHVKVRKAVSEEATFLLSQHRDKKRAYREQQKEDQVKTTLLKMRTTLSNKDGRCRISRGNQFWGFSHLRNLILGIVWPGGNDRGLAWAGRGGSGGGVMPASTHSENKKKNTSGQAT